MDLRGRTVVVTGASSGIGAAAARRFAALGARVAVVGRSLEKTTSVARGIGAMAHVVDYGDLDDVRRLARELLEIYPRIDVLANNAGGWYTSRNESRDGHELTFQVNHLAPFLLTNLLLNRLAQAPQSARVVNTASMDHLKGRLDLDDLDGTRRRYHWRSAYATAKLATVIFTRELARRSRETRLTTSAFHPGVVASDVARDSAMMSALMGTRLFKAMTSTPEQGAEPLLHLATTPDAAAVNGKYFNRLKPGKSTNPQVDEPDLARRLWERSAELTNLPDIAFL
ncbi:SDR family NAD(P)-dependent oxidoreductase [Streptomyces muensis]|uniref:SDR family NAD(P)-dependent oxidoreductase n=1 Tax=Streptomyces muensis TaxID=1077944 RepID=A0A9X1PTQ7_STRM4|nr:SDR family NAD(P)-dependent oxidoreductase [Streptomyces muensis]MCF1592355.1 SDR family NAD(P)-dependent oxidoreductase [Streptomyces muensis]